MKHYYKNIAQLKRKGLSNRQISVNLNFSRNTIDKAIRAINDSGLTLIEVEQLSETEINKLFSIKPGKKIANNIVKPNYKFLAKELSKPGVTLQLLWEEYVVECRLANKSYYQITQFKKYFNEYLKSVDFSDVITHKAGEKIEVDWSGVRPSWKDPDTNELIRGQLFVGVLPFSKYVYAEITADMKLPTWLRVHINMFNYFGGVSKILVPDNLKTGVIKNSKYELDLNRSYNDLVQYYGAVIVPTRVAKPKDKSSVEGSVKHAQTQLLARMRNHQFFSIKEANQQLLVELKYLNDKPFQKREGSRSILFNTLEKPCLIPLPKYPYEIATWKKAKVQSNSHISYANCNYSIPFKLIGKEVKVKVTDTDLIIFYKGEELCAHKIAVRKGTYVTNIKHMPPSSNVHSEWNKDRYVNWSKQKGEYVHQVVIKCFEKSKIEQQQYKSVHSILKLADKFTNERLNDACQLSLRHTRYPSYKNIKAILDNNQDILEVKLKKERESTQQSRFLRGGKYYE